MSDQSVAQRREVKVPIDGQLERVGNVGVTDFLRRVDQIRVVHCPERQYTMPVSGHESTLPESIDVYIGDGTRISLPPAVWLQICDAVREVAPAAVSA